MITEIEGTIGNAGFYADCIPVMVILIAKKYANVIPSENGKRVDITIRIGNKLFRAGIRTTEKMDRLKICPNLLDERGEPVRLSDALSEIGVRVKDRVLMRLEDHSVEIFKRQPR
jgi:hypothetical protein